MLLFYVMFWVGGEDSIQQKLMYLGRKGRLFSDSQTRMIILAAVIQAGWKGKKHVGIGCQTGRSRSN